MSNGRTGGSYGACDTSFNRDGTLETDGCLTGIDSDFGKWTLLENEEDMVWYHPFQAGCCAQAGPTAYLLPRASPASPTWEAKVK